MIKIKKLANALNSMVVGVLAGAKAARSEHPRSGL